MTRLLVIVGCLLLSGCYSYKESTRIQIDTIYVKVPISEDSLSAFGIGSEGDLIGTEIHGKDTVTVIKYLKGKNKFYYKIKHDSILVPIVDSIQVFQGFTKAEKDAEFKYGLFWGIGILFMLGLLLLVLKLTVFK